MDKNLECQYLAQVFGSSCAKQFVPGERPDFTLALSDGSVLGVETTSVFASNSAAKLIRLPDYRKTLLRDPSRLHRRDRGHVEVLENAKLTLGENEVTANILRYEVPSMFGMLERLKELINSKSRKLVEYRKRCVAVDLIIADEQGTLCWQQPEHFRVWLSHFLPRETLLESGFREIYLTTPTVELGIVSVALKGSLFTSDVHTFINLALNSLQPTEVLCACLSRSGYGDAHVSLVGDVHHFRRGAWVVEHRGDAITTGDMRLDLRHDLHPTLDSLSAHFSTLVKAEAEHFVAKRSSTLGGAGLLLVNEGAEPLRRREGKPHFLPPPRLQMWTGSISSTRTLPGRTIE